MPQRHAKTALATVQRFPQEPEPRAVPVKRLTLNVTADHAEQAYWARFRDPVSLALRELLNDHTAVCVLWQSDGWRPRYSDDTADIHLDMELHDDNGNFAGELHYELPLPRRATTAMKRLAGLSRGRFEPTTSNIHIPTAMLAPA